MQTEDIDPITFEVLRGSLESICNEMGITLARCALSMVINQGRDFSGAIFTREGDLAMQGEEDLPGHIGTQPFACKIALGEVGWDNLRPGDVVISNDPYRGGTHKPDVRLFKPIYWEDELVAIVGNSGHWPDIGGAVPGSFAVDAIDTIAEGFTIPPLKIVEQGKVDEKVERFILSNVRIPLIAGGDLRAMISALNTGETRLHELFQKYGKRIILRMMEENIAYSERLLRAELLKLSEGTYEWTDYMDQDPGKQEKIPIKIHLAVTIKDGQALYDFNGSDPQALGSYNCPISTTCSGVFVATKALFPHVPVNQGVYRVLEIRAPEGSVVNPRPPTPVCGAALCVEKIVSCVLGCYAQVIPERVMACSANLINFCLGGIDTREESPLLGEPYVMYCWSEGGYGGRADRDNQSFLSFFASSTKNQPVELFEQQFPTTWLRYEFFPDSAGPGKYRGGMGVWRRIRMDGTRGTISTAGDREDHPPWGLFGGRKGHNQGLVLNMGTDKENRVGLHRSKVPVQRGDIMELWSGGGGGFGDPLERDPERVLEDLKDGIITLEGGRRDYGVVIKEIDAEALEYCIDLEATRCLREKLKTQSWGGQ